MHQSGITSPSLAVPGEASLSPDLAPGPVSPRPIQPLTLIQYHGTYAQPMLCRAQEISSTCTSILKQKTAPYWRDPDPDAPSQTVPKVSWASGLPQHKARGLVSSLHYHPRSLFSALMPCSAQGTVLTQPAGSQLLELCFF